MSSQCVFNDKGVQCTETVTMGLFCTKHAGAEPGKPYTADETPAKKERGGGGGGWSIIGRTGVVYQKEK